MTYSVILGEGEFRKLLQGYDVPFIRFCQMTLEEAEFLYKLGFEQGFFVVMWEDTYEAEKDDDECICASAFSEDDDWEDESALSTDDNEDNDDGEEQNEAS